MAIDAPDIRHRKLRFNYTVLDTIVAGIALLGSEVKSLRAGKASISEAYCYFKDTQTLLVKNMHISPYLHAETHDALRERRLLLRKNELIRWKIKMEQQNATMVPARLFFNKRGFAKMEIALVKGKKKYDKRESIKARETERALSRLRK